MSASLPPTPGRRFDWYHRFMTWLWFGPLTRDLYPYRPLEQWRRPRP